MFLNTREQFIVYAVILLISGFLLYRFVVSPELKHVSAAHFHLDSQQVLLKIKTEEAQHHSILNDRVQQLKTAITETKGLLFSRNEAMDFLRLLPQLISQTGSVLITMEPRDMENLSSGGAVVQGKQEQQVPEPEAEWSCMRMPVQVAIRGEYSEIIRLLEQLAEREQLVVVSEIDIATAEDCPAEVDSEVMLNLYVYEYQEI
jgi:Tfp pilus assembly protein PilO